MTTNIISLNVRGISNKVKRDKLFCWLKEQPFDICLLQETHSTMETNLIWEKEWGKNSFFSGESSNSKGTAILINGSYDVKIIAHHEILKGRIQALQLEKNNHTFIIINIYGPNNDDIMVFNKLDQYIKDNYDQTFIVGGDFNTTLNESLDKKNGARNTHTQKRRKMHDIIESNELTDIWRHQHQDRKQFTWHSNTRPTVFCRLDYFLVSNNLINYTTSSSIKPGYNTDHSLVKIELDLLKLERGPGFFKINNSVLLDTEYQNIIKKAITDITEVNSNANPNTLWEVIKGAIRNETIKYTTSKVKKDKEQMTKITNEINNIERNISNTNNTEEIEILKQTLVENKAQLNDITDKKIKGTLVRLKAEELEYDEKNSKYFANIEKKRSEQKTIVRLNIDGVITSNQNEIREEQFKFYSDLYNKKQTHESDINFFNNNITKLSEEDKNRCENILSEYECGIALKEMKNSKSPGSDGITTEFYKLFWNDLKKHYVNSINHSFATGGLTELQTQGLITLLPKPEKDLSLLSNWRPICLLNNDYKIATKAIANRIKIILNKIIDSSQTGFVKGRYIGENIRLLNEILDHAENTNSPGLLFFSDFEKAFDTVDHTYIMKCLRHFNFGDDLIKWVSLFYSKSKNAVLNNGHMTNFFEVKRGVRQGCPLSPYIFIICIELLSHEIANNRNIRGINIGDIEIRRTLFADDATFLTDGTEHSFNNLIEILDKFSQISGLKLNSSKCNILRIGSLKPTNITYLKHRKFNWRSDRAKALGITFNTNTQLLLKENFEESYEKFKVVLKRWQHRKLTLMGKITVIKSFAMPILLYPLSTLNLPSIALINSVQKLLYDYVWDSKPDKISRIQLKQPYENGGLKMIDINFYINSLKCTWIKRIYDENNTGQWKNIYEKKLNRNGGKLIFESELSKEIIRYLYDDSKFLKEILLAWLEIKKLEKTTIGKQLLWNNKNITIGNNPVFFKEWSNKGINYIEDVYDYRNKTFHPFQYLVELYHLHEQELMHYNQLISCLKSKFKHQLEVENMNDNMDVKLIYKFLRSNESNKYTYNIQMNNTKQYDNKSQNKWEQDLGEANINWKKVYQNIFKATIDTKLRNFQYKYITRIIPTNKKLLKFNIKPSNLCDFCSMHVETLRHLFWECQHIQNFWRELSNHLNSINFTIDINYKAISLGLYEERNFHTKYAKIYIILSAKYYIFKKKCNGEIPNANQYISQLKQRIEIEKIIAFKKDKLAQHEIKWRAFQQRT